MNIEKIKKNIEDELNSCKDMKSLNDLKVKYLGKKVLLQNLVVKLKKYQMKRRKSLV